MRAALPLTLATLFFTTPLVVAAPEVSPGQVSPLAGNVPREDPAPFSSPSVGVDALLSLPERSQENGILLKTALAQLEQQGNLPPGSVAMLAARGDVYNPSGPASHALHDFRATCDLDGDGVRDAITNDYDPASDRSDVFARSGADGEHFWRARNLFYLTIDQYSGGLYPARARVPGGQANTPHGTPEPRFAENFGETPDLDGDGVCDFIAFGFEHTRTAALGSAAAYAFRVTVHAINGATGQDIWARSFDGLTAFAATPSNPEIFHYELRGFPSGFLVLDTPAGPRYVLKTTDIAYTYAWERSLTSFRLTDYRVDENVTYWDARPGKDAPLWKTQIQFGNDGSATNFTWFTGAARLDDDAEPEILLDAHWVADPQCTCEMNDPITGRPMSRYGRGVGAFALNGADGTERWRTVVYDELYGRVNPQLEESFQIVVWTMGQIVPDLNGNGVADVMVLYLAVEVNEAGPGNGRMRTHLRPLEGSDGSPIWRGDHQFRGWGYVSGLHADGGTSPYIAFASADLPVAGETVAGGRFPEKFVQLRVLDSKDGTLVWDYEERFHQDGYLPFDLALHQYWGAVAPHDWDADGLLDLVTPARYVAPPVHSQELLSSARQEYQVLSGADGRVLQSLTTWGSNGYAVPCPGALEDLTIVSGHGRRVDFARFDAATGTRLWRQPLFNDARIQSATRGGDVLALGAACSETSAGSEPRTFAGVNLWRSTPHRGREVSPVVAFLGADGVPFWMDPDLKPDPGILSFFDLLPEPLTPPTPVQHATVNGTPILLGVAAGLGLGLLRNRVRRPREALA